MVVAALGFLGVEGVVVAEICCGFSIEDIGVHFGIDVGCIDGDGRCQGFGPGGSLDQRVNFSLRAPAQMGWREMEHKGETWLVLSHTRGVCS